MKSKQRRLGVLVSLVVVLTTGCASGKRDLTARDYWPSGARWKQSTMQALKSRGTWVPLVGAAVVSIDDWDQHLSEWAVENTPVFGSTDHAQEASDNLRAATGVAMVGTALAVPNGSGAWETRPERIVLELLTVTLNNGLTSGLKRLTDRERPDGAGDDSFPSGHSSQAFVQTELACLNINGMRGLSEGWKIALKTSFRAMAWGTAWARVEGGRHYPSDVLFGAALGNFVAIFVHNAFLPADSRTRVTAAISRREVSFSVALSF